MAALFKALSLDNYEKKHSDNDNLKVISDDPSLSKLSEVERPLETLDYYKIIISSQLSGRSALPYGLGLDREAYSEVLKALNDKGITALSQRWQYSASESLKQKSTLISELVLLRASERDALTEMLTPYRAANTPFVEAAAIVISTACLNPNHLWDSLGLGNRRQLSLWLNLNFPALAQANNKAMRWKRFFYLQLCQKGGDFVCRAPSCEQCSSFDECFGPE